MNQCAYVGRDSKSKTRYVYKGLKWQGIEVTSEKRNKGALSPFTFEVDVHQGYTSLRVYNIVTFDFTKLIRTAHLK